MKKDNRDAFAAIGRVFPAGDRVLVSVLILYARPRRAEPALLPCEGPLRRRRARGAPPRDHRGRRRDLARGVHDRPRRHPGRSDDHRARRRAEEARRRQTAAGALLLAEQARDVHEQRALRRRAAPVLHASLLRERGLRTGRRLVARANLGVAQASGSCRITCAAKVRTSSSRGASSARRWILCTRDASPVASGSGTAEGRESVSACT